MCSFGSGRDTVRIRAIGNSFSVDAVEQHSWPLAHSVGKTVIVGNMYIPGCFLERHYDNMLGDKPDYSCRKTSAGGTVTETPGHTLEQAKDYVGLHQASPLSGLPACTQGCA